MRSTNYEVLSRYYDLLYRDKRYDTETDFIEIVLGRFSKGEVNLVLDLGCGTGGHAVKLAERGYELVCVDRSREMLSLARAKFKALGIERSRFLRRDISNLKIPLRADAAISMFAVFSYFKTINELKRAFREVHGHLKPKGVFLFDVWNGMAVLGHGPKVTIKEVLFSKGGKRFRVERRATPKLDRAKQVCRITYDFRIEGPLGYLSNTRTKKYTEIHNFRYYFPSEIQSLLEDCEFSVLDMYGDHSIDRPPSISQWYTSVAAVKR